MNTETDFQKVDAKIEQWERKLLDLSLRNGLLNMRLKGNMIPVFSHSPSLLEAKLAENVDFSIKPRTEEKDKKKDEAKVETSVDVTSSKENNVAEEAKEDKPDANPAEETRVDAVAVQAVVKEEPPIEDKTIVEQSPEPKQSIPVKEYDLENISDMTGFEDLIADGFDRKLLYSCQTKAELEVSMNKLYRSAKVALEENGANTLYLALGVMRWFERDSTTPRYAPLIMIPIDLVRKSVISGCKIRRRDAEEIIVNITLLQKLKQDFGIESDSKAVLATDESGVNIDKTLENFKDLIEGQENWDIFNSCVIGLFSFTNFVMWNDLHVRREQISDNKIVRSLLEGRACWNFKSMEIPDDLDEGGTYLPITADSSQLYAIQCATDGESFVLHGPPGTGKSQTITSMIADMLANKKKVLFVAEKKAALDVVYSRLERIGLSPFCLELHSNKTKKSAFLDKLKAAIELKSKEGSGKYEELKKELADRREELDKYCNALHKIDNSGKSLYEYINIYGKYLNSPDVDLDDGFINSVNEYTMVECIKCLEQVVSAGKVIEDMNCLSAVKTTDYSQELRNELPVRALSLKEKAKQLSDAVNDVRASLVSSNVNVPGVSEDTFKSYYMLYFIANAVLASKDIPSRICTSDDYDSVTRDVNNYLAERKTCVELEDKLFEAYKPDILKTDIVSLTSELMTANSKTLFKSMAVNKVFRKLEPFRLPAAKAVNMMEHFSLARDVNEKRALLDKIYNEKLASYFERTEVDNETVIAERVSKITSCLSKIDEYDRTGMLRKTYAGNQTSMDLWQRYARCFEAYDDEYDDRDDNKNELTNKYGIEPKEIHTFDDVYNMCDDLINNADHLRDRVVFNQALVEAKNKKILNIANAYRDGVVESSQVDPAFRKAFAKLMITKIIDNDDTLKYFNGKIFEDQVSVYKKLNKKYEEYTRQEIYLKVAKSIPQLVEEAQKDSALGILQKAIKNGGRGVSIRSLFLHCYNLITSLCPCILMSPISVAQYLDPRNLKFDTVLFDEASQLPTCKAVGVIARAENAVIVGDPNQMPPTSFFQTTNSEEENFEIEDLESILDDCLACSMPQTHLLWHYRSKHESLIAFSNRAFYENRLYTFPSSNDLERKVSFIGVDGTFDRGKTRTNKVEAEMVVNEIISRITSEPKKSIGVVTFNISQQNLIDDMLIERIKASPELEQALYGTAEPVFIKNLENVQGDERDVILFSVGYGKDEEGKVYMNFGPLTQEGGWRRLNVAVTRARYEMAVFSSLQPEQIKITSDTARGVSAFKSFLEYAQGRSVWEGSATTTSASANPIIDKYNKYTGVVDCVCEMLEKEEVETVNGAIKKIKTQKEVGRSEYKVDIGIVDPENDNNYILGILMDGKFYRENKTTTGREIYQQNVLEGLGWNTMRVWTVDWWVNKDKVIESIVSRINEILEKRKKRDEDISVDGVEMMQAEGEVAEETPVENGSAEESSKNEEASELAPEDPKETLETKKSNPQEAPAGENT